jgi:prepilin-type N-terminal cleavage/methylation domain-containing protein
MLTTSTQRESGVRNQGSVISLRRARCALRHGFTLVELLVVITIIGMLAAISAAYLLKGWNTAKQSRTAAEVTNLAGAMEEFRRQYGDYPPSFLDHTDVNTLALMKRFLAKAFPRCNPNVEVWYIPWCDATNSYYPYKDNLGAISVWDPAGGSPSGAKPMSPAQALVFWLTSISKDPAHPLSALTTDRVSFFDFDNARITRLNGTASTTNSVSGSAWTVVSSAASPPTWTEGPTAVSAGSYPKYNPGTYAPRDGTQQAYVYFEARCYLFHALFTSYPPASPPAPTPPLNNPPIPYLSRSAPWDTNSNGVLDAGVPNPPTTLFDVPLSLNTSNQPVLVPASFTAFQNLCVNPKSFQIISAGLDNDFGLVNTAYTQGSSPGTPAPGVPVSYNPNPTTNSVQSYTIYYKSYPDGQGYDTITNADDDNITNFSEGPLGNHKFER